MRISIARPALLAACLLALPFCLLGQTFKLPPVTFAGAPAFSQSDLLKVSGLQPGSQASQAELQAAAQHLSDTGLFSDVRFASNAGGLVFTLQPMPAANLLPASFTNFVWWSPGELTSAIETRVPLYIGVVPLTGNLQDRITAALKAMVAEKGVTANIAAIPSGGPAGSTPTAISFEIDSPEIRVRNLTFAGASPAMQPKLDKILKEQTGKPFGQETTRAAISVELMEAYRNEGYLDAALLDLTHTAPVATSSGVDLDLTATLREGDPYRISHLTWPGSDVMSTDLFTKQLKLKPGDVASQAALRQSLSILGHAYYAKGYQDARIQAPATKDPATHEVAYTVRVIPGAQYRIQSIHALGLSDAQRKQFDSAWKMKPGDFYDVTYLTEFLHQNTALVALAGYSATYKASSDPDTHLVDLTITFVRGGVLN